jgi:hypothetical protein
VGESVDAKDVKADDLRERVMALKQQYSPHSD